MIVAAPFLGEFGWEVAMWVPWLRYVRQEHYEPHDFLVLCEKGKEALYEDFATDVVGVKTPPVAFRDCQHAWKDGRELLTKRDYLDLARQSCPHPKAIVTPGELHYAWPKDAPPRLVRADHHRYCEDVNPEPGWIAIHARACPDKQPNRNWPIDKWMDLVSGLDAEHVIAVGTDAYAPVGTEDLRGIPLKEVMLALAKCECIIGPSSGPLVLANYCGTPAYWWSQNHKDAERFNKTWNPFRIANKRIKRGWNPEAEQVLEALAAARNR